MPAVEAAVGYLGLGANSWFRRVLRAARTPVRSSVCEHFFLIDLVRGVAAICVVLYHFKHFAAGAEGASYKPAFYDHLSLLYLNGYWAVQLFWMISGFVFASAYAGRRPSARDFMVSRLARLYPLHLLTLLMVAALQWMRFHATGTYAIYTNNDLYHFVLQLFFASNWGFEQGFSFNAPIWSVSIEILIYLVFWFSLPLLYRNGLVWPAILALSFAVLAFSGGALRMLFVCGFCFFSGSGLYILIRQARLHLPLLSASGVVLCAGGVLLAMVVPGLPQWVAVYAMFLGLLIFLSAAELNGLPFSVRWIRFIGDSSYGIYLWHLPMQLAVLLYCDVVVGTRVATETAWFFLCFFAALLAFAHLSYLYIEAPARKIIQNNYRVRRAAKAMAPRPQTASSQDFWAPRR